jgi:hemolysin activation/secretion protein
MRLDMGLRWCEIFIKNLRNKGLWQELTPFSVSIAFTGSLGVIILQSGPIHATPCCSNTNTARVTPLSKVSQESPQSSSNLKFLNETACLEKSHTLNSDKEAQPLNGLNLSFPGHKADSRNPLSASNFDVSSIHNQERTSDLRLSVSPLSIPEQSPINCLTNVVAQQSSTDGQDSKPESVSKSASRLLGTQDNPTSTPLLVVEPSVSRTSTQPTPVRNSTRKASLQAQNIKPDPNQDRFLQPIPNPVPLPPDADSPVEPSPTPTPQPPETESPTPSSPEAIQVQKINVTGSTIFDADELNPIIQPYEGRTLTVEELREVADKITQLYLDRGYITSRAILQTGPVQNGVVDIAVLEGSLEEIRVEGNRRVRDSYIRSRVGLGAGKPLNTGELEDQLRLLRADPLFENVEASLRAGTRTGQSLLIVRVTEADPFEGSVSIDNYSPPSVGSERLGLNLLYRNLTGYGDTIAAAYYHTTTSGADIFDFSYAIPLNPMNGTLQLRAAPNRNKITQESLSTFGIRGESELYEVSFRQPLIRSPREEFALSLGFTYQEGQTFIFNDIPQPFGEGPDADGVSATRIIKFGQDYLRRDVKGAWSLRSLFSFGIGALGATINDPPTPDGRFVSWLGQVQRVQILNEDNFLIMGVDVQLTPNSLLPSQQFVIGGGQSLRGYRQNIRSGDNGVRFSVEDRITLERNEAGASIFQLAPFFDAGYVWNKSDNPNNAFLPSQRFLAGVGLGLIWEPVPRLNLRLDYGYPLIKLDDKGNNAQDEGFYFSVRYQF